MLSSWYWSNHPCTSNSHKEYVTFHVWILGLKNWHVQMCRSKAFLIMPPPPVTSTTRCFTHSGVSIWICTSSILRRRGWVSRTLLCWSGLGRPSSLAACRCPCGPFTPHVFLWTSLYNFGWSTPHQWRGGIRLVGGQVRNWSAWILCPWPLFPPFLCPHLMVPTPSQWHRVYR